MPSKTLFTVRQFAFDYGIDRATLVKSLTAANVDMGRGIKHPMKVYIDAINQSQTNMRKATDEAKLKILQEEAAMKEMQRKVMQCDLIEMSAVEDYIIKRISPLSNLTKNMPAKYAPRCNPSDPVHARQVLSDYPKQVESMIEKACLRNKKN